MYSRSAACAASFLLAQLSTTRVRGVSSFPSCSFPVLGSGPDCGRSATRALARVRCARKNEHTLLSVDEPQVHSYVLVFSTPLACELNCVLSYAPRP